MIKLKTNNNGIGIIGLIIILLVIVGLIFTGWFVYKHQHKNTPQVVNLSNKELTITRDNPLKQPGVSDFTKTVSHASAVTIMQDIKSLKAVPGGPYAMQSCPNDDGVKYTFTFSKPDLKATADASGCQSITLNNKTYNTTAKFWNDVIEATSQPQDPDTNFQ
jgi:hypothetical protein